MENLEDLLKLSEKYITLLNRQYIRNFVRKDPFKTRLTIVLGQRGVGKTTAIVQYFLQRKAENSAMEKKLLYLPADHFLIGNRALYEIAETFSQLGGEIICFDEIHKYSNWSQELKSIYDTFPELKVIASGSSALEVHKGSHDLSRRAIVKQMPGFSFREYLEVITGKTFPIYTLEEILKTHERCANYIIDVLKKPKILRILNLFQDYLKKGYYPYFTECTSEEDFYFTLERSVHTTIESDIPSVHPSITAASIKKIIRLLSFIAQQVPFKPHLNKLTEILDLNDQRILKTYLKYLEDAGLINTVSKAGKGLSVLEKPEKIFLDNTNQVYAFGKQDSNTGNLRETFFVNVLSSRHSVFYSDEGDFMVNNHTFEVGGKNKSFKQIRNIKNSYVVLDDVESGINNKIPLWLFGFLY